MHNKIYVNDGAMGIFFFFFFREFQPMVSVSNDSSFTSDQDTNQFLVWVRIESQISYSTIRDFTN